MNETERMEEVWGEYARTQLSAGQKFEEEHPELKPKTKAEEVHAWEDYTYNLENR